MRTTYDPAPELMLKLREKEKLCVEGSVAVRAACGEEKERASQAKSAPHCTTATGMSPR